MTSPRLPSRVRSIAAALFRQTRQRLAYGRQQERERAARTCVRLRRETRLQLQARRRLLHVLLG